MAVFIAQEALSHNSCICEFVFSALDSMCADPWGSSEEQIHIWFWHHQYANGLWQGWIVHEGKSLLYWNNRFRFHSNNTYVMLISELVRGCQGDMDFGEGEPRSSWKAHCGLRLFFLHSSVLHFSYCRSRSGMEERQFFLYAPAQREKNSFPVTQSSEVVVVFFIPSSQRWKFLSPKREKNSPTWRRNLALCDLRARFSSSLT